MSARIAIATKLSGDGGLASVKEFGNEGHGVTALEERTCNESFFIGKLAVMAHRNLLLNKDLGYLYCNRVLYAFFIVNGVLRLKRTFVTNIIQDTC